MRAPECLGAVVEPLGSLEGEINDRTLHDAAAAIAPAERDVHGEIERLEALAALRRPPHCNDAAARDDAVDDIGRRGPWPQFLERDEAIGILFVGVLLRRHVAGLERFESYDGGVVCCHWHGAILLI